MMSTSPVAQAAACTFGASLIVYRSGGGTRSRTSPFSNRPMAEGAWVRLARLKASNGRRIPTNTTSPSAISRAAATTISSCGV